MGCEAACFGCDLGIYLVHCPVAVFEDVVVVIEFGEPLSHGHLMSVVLVNPESELLRCQLASEHATCERSGGGFLSGIAGDRTQGFLHHAQKTTSVSEALLRLMAADQENTAQSRSSRPSVGRVLQQARTDAGLTVEELSSTTRVRIAVVRAIEQNDFTHCGEPQLPRND